MIIQLKAALPSVILLTCNNIYITDVYQLDSHLSNLSLERQTPMSQQINSILVDEITIHSYFLFFCFTISTFHSMNMYFHHWKPQ